MSATTTKKPKDAGELTAELKDQDHDRQKEKVREAKAADKLLGA